MRYRLHIDDDAGKEGMELFRNPPAGEEDWRVAHSTDEALAIVAEFGIPSHISFDHDLGSLLHQSNRYWFDTITDQNDTSLRFLKVLAYQYPEAIELIEDYTIHSKNEEGAKNIQAFMDSWKRSRRLT